MAGSRKKRERSRSSGGNRQPKSARQKSRSTFIVSQSGSPRHLRSAQSTDKGFAVFRDLRAGKFTSVSKAARAHHISVKSLRENFASQLRKNNSGRLAWSQSDRLTRPTELPRIGWVRTHGSKERLMVSEWFAAYYDFAGGNAESMLAFHKKYGKSIFLKDGTRLPTSAYELQRMVEAQERQGEAVEMKSGEAAKIRAGAR